MRFLTTSLIWLMIALPKIVEAAELTNPLHTTDLRMIIKRIIQAILGLTGSVALLMFVYGGFRWLISGGKPENVKKGTQAIKWAVAGIALILGSYMIISTLIRVLESGSL